MREPALHHSPGGAIDPAVGHRLGDPPIRLPALALREDALANNISVLARFCERAGVSLAPHGKTTMAPDLFRRQLDAGAWAITAANPWQAEVATDAGARRVIIANEVVDAAGLAWIGDTLERTDVDLFVNVDSEAAASLLADGLRGCRRALAVLLEVGYAGGRAGTRSREEALAVAAAVDREPGLSLAGVTAFEGLVTGPTRDERERRVRDLLEEVRATLLDLRPLLDRSSLAELLVTAGGSGYLDIVAEMLARPLEMQLPVRPVLRSGAYVLHDHGPNEAASPFGARAPAGRPRLRPAIEIWAPVLSLPEPGLAILGAGRRELPSDQGLPSIVRRRGVDGEILDVTPPVVVAQLNDHHAHVTLPAGLELAVGDLVGLGIAHPCTAMQRWRKALVIDDDGRVLAVYPLRF